MAFLGSSITFINQQTVVPVNWLQDVNNLTYGGQFYAPTNTFSGNVTVTGTTTLGNVTAGGTTTLSGNVTVAGTTTLGTVSSASILASNGNNVEATSGPGGSPLSLRNKLINATFVINQRGIVPPVTAAANVYGFDRWKAGSSGATYSFTASGQINVITITAGSLQQVIESFNIPAGTYTLSWVGTSTATVNGTAVANGGQVTIPGTANVTVAFSTGTLSLPQLEPGNVSTPFEYRSVGLELLLCQRYFYSITFAHMVAVAFTTSSLFFGHIHPVPMRATPSLQVSVPFSTVQSSGGVSTSYTLAQDATTPTMAGYYITGMNNGPTAAWQAARVQGGTMWWSAEL